MSEYGTFIAGDAVRFVRSLPGSVDKVWSYLVEPEKRAKWFAAGPMDLIPGGEILLEFNHNSLSPEIVPIPDKYKEMSEGMTSPGRVISVDAPNRLVFAWGGPDDKDVVTIELEPEGDRTRLTLTHEKLATRNGLLSVSGGWHAHLAILEEVLSDQVPGPIWPRVVRLEAEYDALIPPATA